VKTEAEAGVMQLPTKDLQGMPEPLGAGKGKEQCFPRDFRGDMALPTLYLGLLAFRIVRE
jgi:hypothetical protein